MSGLTSGTTQRLGPKFFDDHSVWTVYLPLFVVLESGGCSTTTGDESLAWASVLSPDAGRDAGSRRAAGAGHLRDALAG